MPFSEALKHHFADKAQDIIVTGVAELSEDEFFEFMDELSWFDFVRYNSAGEVETTLNKLQQVGLAAALSVYLRSRDGNA